VWQFGISVIVLVIFSQRLISLWLRNLFGFWCLLFEILRNFRLKYWKLFITL